MQRAGGATDSVVGDEKLGLEIGAAWILNMRIVAVLYGVSLAEIDAEKSCMSHLPQRCSAGRF